MRAAGRSAGTVLQPTAQIGQLTYCPVSGVVFRVEPSSPHRDVGGKPLYFCCEACADYFSAHADRVLALRGLSPPLAAPAPGVYGAP